MLELKGVSAGYPEKQVLSNLSLTVPEGKLTAVVGPNGCGKSTLLRSIAGILPSEGEILLDGAAVSMLPSKERARKIGVLPQSRTVPEITARKLVLHGRFPWVSYPRSYREEDRVLAREAMEQLGIVELADRYLPELSGGERQKVYLAMLLAQQTPVILMDEPTTYLDIANRFELMQLVHDLADRGKTVLMVLHDLELALAYAHRVAVMDGGQIRYCGTAEEVFQSGILQQVFHIRVDRIRTPEGDRYCFLPNRG